MRDGNWKLVAAAFLASQCLTLVGSSAVQMAIAWYVAVETSSGAWAAAMLVAGFVPQMAVSPFAGAWIDRRGFRKAAIIAADAVSAATALALAVFLATSFGDMAALVAASSVRSLCAGVQMPAVQSSVAILVPEEALLRYNRIVSAVQNVAQFAAVPLAALTLSFGGISSAMLLDVVTAAVAVGVLAVAVKLPRVEATSCALSQEKAGLFEDVREGARYARDERAVGFVLASYGAFIYSERSFGVFRSASYGARIRCFVCHARLRRGCRLLFNGCRRRCPSRFCGQNERRRIAARSYHLRCGKHGSALRRGVRFSWSVSLCSARRFLWCRRR